MESIIIALSSRKQGTYTCRLLSEQVEFMKHLSEQGDSDLTDLINKLGLIAAELLDCGSLR